MIDLDALSRPPFPVDPTTEAVNDARAFALAKWQERHDAMSAEHEAAFGQPWLRPRPDDLSSSCKFTSIFAAVVFGGKIMGNDDHQFAVVDGEVLDLNDGAADVAVLETPYEHDPEFFGNPDHVESLLSCLPRIEAWISAYASELLEREHASGPFAGVSA